MFIAGEKMGTSPLYGIVSSVLKNLLTIPIGEVKAKTTVIVNV